MGNTLKGALRVLVFLFTEHPLFWLLPNPPLPFAACETERLLNSQPSWVPALYLAVRFKLKSRPGLRLKLSSKPTRSQVPAGMRRAGPASTLGTGGTGGPQAGAARGGQVPSGRGENSGQAKKYNFSLVVLAHAWVLLLL